MNILPLLKNEKKINEGKHLQGPFKIQKISLPTVEQYFPNGSWNEQENSRYAVFLDQNKKLFSRRKPSTSWTEFKNMANFVKTRNLRQCKSHHTKLYNEFSSVEGILYHFFQSSPSFEMAFLKSQKELLISLTTISSEVVSEVKIQQGYKPIIPEVVKPGNPDAKTSAQYKSEQDAQNYQKIKAFQENANKMLNVQNGYDNFLNEKGFGFTFRPPIEQDREQEWIQCHTVFMLWATKLRKLTSQPI